MAINADTLLDRIYLKSQITKWRILAVVFAALALIIFLERHATHSPIEGAYVARLSIDGIITDNKKLYQRIDDMADNPHIKAVIVWLDTPGGSAVGGEETFLSLRKLAQKKPVVTVMRSIAASAGYLTALGGDYILARPGTITGSIGVIIETAEVTDLAAKLGIKPIIIKSSPLKAMPSPFEKDTPESDAVIKTVIDDFYNRFVDIVAERRNLPRPQVLQLADGRVYSGQAAVNDKLVDAIGGEKEAMQWLADNRHIPKTLDIKDVQIDQKNSLFDDLTDSIAGKFFNTSRVTLDGLVAIWHPQFH